MDFLFSILLSSYLDFCEKFLKKFEKIMKSDMGIPPSESGPLWPLYSTPDQQLNRRVFYLN